MGTVIKQIVIKTDVAEKDISLCLSIVPIKYAEIKLDLANNTEEIFDNTFAFEFNCICTLLSSIKGEYNNHWRVWL